VLCTSTLLSLPKVKGGKGYGGKKERERLAEDHRLRLYPSPGFIVGSIMG
jgi:hypothetical protein